MATRSLQDHIETLLQRRVVEGRTRGTSNPQLESAALLESIALNLLLRPKAVLYIALLAKNGLLKACRDELDAIENLKGIVSDLSNVSYNVTNLAPLQKAKTALVEMQQLDKIDPSNPVFKKFTRFVDEFLNKSINKNVKNDVSAELLRPGAEASADLPSALAELKTVHDSFLDRLYALSVGVDNYRSSSFGTILGLSASARAHDDIQSIIDQLEADQSPNAARDIVTRLIGDKAALQQIGSTPGIFDSYTIDMTTVPTTARVQTQDVDSVPLTGWWRVNNWVEFVLPISGVGGDVGDWPCIIGDRIDGDTVSIASGTYLFLDVGKNGVTTHYKVDLGSGDVQVTAIPALIENGTESSVICRWMPNERRFLLVSDSDSLSVAPIFLAPPTDATTLISTPFTMSASESLGLSLGHGEERGPKSLGLTLLLLKNENTGLGIVKEGKHLIFTAQNPDVPFWLKAEPLGIVENTKFEPSTDLLTTAGVVGVGDVLDTPVGQATVIQVTDKVQVDRPLPTFSGPVTVTSPLKGSYLALDAVVQPFIVQWLKTKYSDGLARIDPLFAALIGDQSSANCNAAVQVLEDLSNKLSDLVASLSSLPELPPGSVEEERSIVAGIIASLEERGYDRAVDFLSYCKIQELFEMDSETASYGGALMQAMVGVAQSDVSFSNTATDEQAGLKGRQRRSSR